MRRTRFYLSAILALFVLVGAFAWRVPSQEELLHRNPALALRSGHTVQEVPRVATAGNVAGISMPIEVFSGTGTATKTVSVNVNNGDGQVNRLWMQVHQPSYKYGPGSRATEGLKVQDKSSADTSPKMWVRVNGGGWVKVDNSTATCARLESGSKVDCIGGGFETVRFSVPVSGVKNGANTVEFYFNGTDGFTSGYRVLDFDFLSRGFSGDLTHDAIDQAGAGRITDALVYEDMTQWTAPAGYTSAADISAGKAAFESAQLVDFAGGPRLKATCSDCHAQNGRDLKYFNYSNESIVARSRHHGLSEAQANQIAAYIRSLDAPAVGTPWDPPYQPGPTRKLPTMGDCIEGRSLDELPQHCWAAGAGLDWVLESDLDAEPYMFPNGITEDVVDVDGMLNIRAIPVAAQFPDWNEWLPRVHPKDGWGAEFTSNDVNTFYSNNVLPTVSNPSSKASGEALDRLLKWGSHYNTFRMRKAKYGDLDKINGEKLKADYLLGFTQWYGVKQWEVMHTYGLEDMAPLPKNYGKDGEVRSWVGTVRNVFDIAPHIHWKHTFGRDLTWPHGSKDQWTYYSAIWYQLQLTLNAGNRNGGNIGPVDWKYQMQFIPSGQPYRHAATYVKMLQQVNNKEGVDTGDRKGWYFRHVTPAWLFNNASDVSKGSALADLGPKEPAVMTAIMQAWIEKTMRHPVSDWKLRPDGCNQTGLSSAAYKPTPHTGGKWLPGGCYADHVYRLIPELENRGVAKSTLDSIATWGAKMWPKGNWSSLVDYKPSQNPGVALKIDQFASPALDAQYRKGDVITFAGTTTNDGSVARMEGWVNGVKKCEDAAAPFRCTWKAESTGRFRAAVKFFDGNGTNMSSVERGFDVVAANAPVAQKLKLKKGWNTVSLPVVPADSSIQSVMSGVIGDVVLVKDASGRVFSPELEVAQISHWSPRRAYMVYAKRESDWTVQGAPLAPAEVAIGLNPGWNLVPYPSTESMPVDIALEPVAEDLVLVSDADGNVYYPSSDINTIGLLSPGRGYKVYVEQACTLVYTMDEQSVDALTASAEASSVEASDAGPTEEAEDAEMLEDPEFEYQEEDGIY